MCELTGLLSTSHKINRILVQRLLYLLISLALHTDEGAGIRTMMKKLKMSHEFLGSHWHRVSPCRGRRPHVGSYLMQLLAFTYVVPAA